MSRALLLRGAYVVPEPGRVIADGAVLVEGGNVAAVGTFAEVRARAPRAPSVRVIGGPDRVVIPGLVNAHAHGNAVDATARGIPDQPLESWIHALAGGPSLDPYVSTLAADLFLLESGVTTVLHHAYEESAEGFERIFRAHGESGIRATVALGISDQNRLVHAGEEEFLASLPAEVRPAAEALGRVKRGDADAWLAMALDLAARRSGGRLRIALGPSGPQWCSDRLWERVAAASEEKGLLLHTHVAESLVEKAHARRAYGRSAVAHLDKLGVLSPRCSLAHAVWLEPGDAEAIAGAGATVVRNVGSNLRLRNGIAPLRRLRALGVRVGLGTDDTTMNGDHDLLGEMRLAWRLHRPPDLREEPLAARDVLEMATRGGAAAAGHGPGILAPGAPADAVLLDLPAILGPLPGLPAGLEETLLARARGSHVDTVVVGGEVVVRGGRHVGVDRAEILKALRAALRAPRRRTDLAAAAVLVWPWIARYYSRWLDEAGESDGKLPL